MNAADAGLGLGILSAFVGGVLSFASPCCLRLVPAYISYMVGTTTEGQADRRRSFFHGLAFVVGFSLVFVAFWASIGLIGYILADNPKYLRQLGGALLIFLGLQVAGVINVRAFWRDTRMMPAFAGGTMSAPGMGTGDGADAAVTAIQAPGYGRSLAFGAFFAAAGAPASGRFSAGSSASRR